MSTEYEPSSLTVIGSTLTSEYVRDILAVLARFAVKRTHGYYVVERVAKGAGT
jgi:hypothetical protein